MRIAVRTTPPPFEDFLEAQRATILRFLWVAVGPSEADDVFQETFLAALRAWPRVVDDGRLDRWILRIASRKAIDHHRGAARRPLPVAEGLEGPAGAQDAAGPAVADRDDDLWDAVRALPTKQRLAVVHRHVLDRPYTEIAEILGCSEAAARKNVSDGTKRLGERIR
jgi:RNA polymerase sigma factor (sigma-70 family)